MTDAIDPQNVVEQSLCRLTAKLAADGYEPGYPTWELTLDTLQRIDIEIAADVECPKCGTNGCGHAGFVCSDGSRSWRGFAICPACGWAEEFTA
jgi:hypothetical protein